MADGQLTDTKTKGIEEMIGITTTQTTDRLREWLFLKEKLTAFFPTYPILPPGGVATPSPSRTDPDGDTVCIRTLPKVGFKRIL